MSLYYIKASNNFATYKAGIYRASSVSEAIAQAEAECNEKGFRFFAVSKESFDED